AGKKLDVGRPAVRFLRPVPSALITQMFFLPVVLPRELSNAILEPSGDHVGWAPSSGAVGPGSLLTRCALVPSAFITQRERSRLNAILDPSLENAGSRSTGPVVRA